MASLSTLTNTQYYFLCLFLSVLSIFLLRFFFGKPTKKVAATDLHLPPSPPALPLIGHLHLLAGSSMYKSLHKLSIQHGPLFCLRLGPYRTMLVVSSASVATEVFKANDVAVSNRPAPAVADKAPYAGVGFFNAPYGKYWRFMKKLSMTQLLGTKQIERSRSIRREELVQFLCRLFDSAQRRELVDLGTELVRFTNNSTCKMAMSTKVSGDSSEAEQIRALVKETLELGSKLFLGDFFGPFKRLSFWMYGKKAIDVTMRYDAILERLWKEHEETGKRDNDQDLMDILIKVYKDEKAEFKMTRTHIKAFLLDLFIAGTSTSADILQWTMSELINRPQMFKKVRDEIVSVVGTGTRLVDEMDVPNLPYVQAVVKETLRMYPPIAVTARECREDCRIQGYDISQNTMLAINLYSIMRDPEVWDNPNEFRPERFLVSNNSKVLHKHQNHENELTGHQSLIDFVPFGAGRRGCPGSTLAYTTINQTIAAIVQCFDWKVGGGGDHDQPPPKVDMGVDNSGFGVNKAQSLVCLPVVHFNPFAANSM